MFVHSTILLAVTLSWCFGIVVKDPPTLDYKYAYVIQDAVTGDNKSLRETRKGNVVTGKYSIIDPDGTRRTVQYTADPVHGFRANVQTVPAFDSNLVNPAASQMHKQGSRISTSSPHINSVPFYTKALLVPYSLLPIRVAKKGPLFAKTTDLFHPNYETLLPFSKSANAPQSNFFIY